MIGNAERNQDAKILGKLDQLIFTNLLVMFKIIMMYLKSKKSQILFELTLHLVARIND